MTERDPEFDAYVLEIRGVLDHLDYYHLLGLERGARASEIKKAFYAIAARFHPDRNRDAPAGVRAALYDIFKRLNEAYRILCDPARRAAYDEGLGEGRTRLEQEARKTAVPKSPEDLIQNREARQFYRQAVEAFRAGNPMQAELHVRMAQSREPGNRVIESLVQQIREQKAKGKRKSP